MESLEAAERAISDGRLGDAVSLYEGMLAEGSQAIGLLLRQLAPLYIRTRQPLRALEAAQASVYFNPTADAHMTLAAVQDKCGLPGESLRSQWRALELSPEDRSVRDAVQFALATALSPAEYKALAMEWAIPSSPRMPPQRTSSPLRVGYVTGDAKTHVMDRVIEPLLRYSTLETVVYDNTAQQDKRSSELRAWGTKWKYIVGLRAEAIAQQVRDDGIDVLVDLSGLTAGNRLDVFALRPAPVQVTAFGSLFTTGMDCFDYRFGDVECQDHYTEPLWELSTSLAPMPLGAGLPITPLPAQRNGYVTFGYVNAARKLTPEFVAQCVSVLKAVPTAQLVIMIPGAADPATAAMYLRRFGPVQDRVLFTESAGGLGFCQLFKDIDIALDPFPYGGCMTSFDTLYHGVPIICRNGPYRVGMDAARLQLQMLMGRFVAKDGDYARVAADVAGNIDALVRTRADLRQRLRAHPAGNPQEWVMEIERAYAQMCNPATRMAA